MTPAHHLAITAAALLCTLAAPATAQAPADPAQPAAADTAPGISPYIVGTIIAGALGGTGYLAGRKHTVSVDPQPLAVRNADTHYVTREEHDADLKRVYDLHYDTSNKLSELIGLVQGIRDTIRTTKHP